MTLWLAARLRELFVAHRPVILSTLLFGLAAHLFIFANKYTTFDDALFGYGASFASGRWGLGILAIFIPGFSAPWLHGMASLLLLCCTMVVLTRLLGIRRRLCQVLLPAVVVTSTVHTSIFLFIFTSTPYLLAVFLATLSVYALRRPGRRWWLSACLLLTLSLSIYQVYITLALGLLLVQACLRMLDPRPITGRDMRQGGRAAAYLATSLAVYFAIAMAFIAMHGGMARSNYDYAIPSDQTIPPIEHFTGVFTNFVALFTERKLGLINTRLSVLLHLVLMSASVLLVFAAQWRQGSKRRLAAQVLLLLVALPMTIQLFWLLPTAPNHWNTLTVYSFICVYVLAVALLDRHARRWMTFDTLAVCLIGIGLNSIYYDNVTYLRVHQQNINNLAFYSGLAAQIKLMPELEASSRLSLVGYAEQFMPTGEGFGVNEVRGAAPLTNVYSRREYMTSQVGFNIPILRRYSREQRRLERDPRVRAMPVYPFAGSIQLVDSVIVVKLGECPE